MAWGAYVAGLVADLGGPVTSNEQGVSVYINAIPFNFYAILMVLITQMCIRDRCKNQYNVYKTRAKSREDKDNG